MVAHGAILRVRAKNPRVADQVAVNYRKAEITPRQKAMLDFAMKVATDSHRVDEADFEALRAHGFSDEDIWDIGAIAAIFALSNRMANVIEHATRTTSSTCWAACRSSGAAGVRSSFARVLAPLRQGAKGKT